jgi:DNA-binding transcriptional MerR regulator
MKRITIKELQNYSGIKAHTIRIWEKRYGLLQPERNSGNIRGYSILQVESLLDIMLLNKNGYKISRLVGMTAVEIQQKRAMLLDEDSVAEKALKELLIAYLKEDIAGMAGSLEKAMKSHSHRQVTRCILLPFATKTGLLWSDGCGLVAMKKISLEMLRRKLFHMIEQVSSKREDNGQTVIIAGMPLEQNDLLLLFAHYFLAEGGASCFALKETSITDITALMRTLQPSSFITAFTRKKNSTIIEKWNEALGSYTESPPLRVLCELGRTGAFTGQRWLFIAIEELAEEQMEVV